MYWVGDGCDSVTVSRLQAAVTMASAKGEVCIQCRLGAAPQPCRGPANTQTQTQTQPIIISP